MVIMKRKREREKPFNTDKEDRSGRSDRGQRSFAEKHKPQWWNVST